MNILVIGDLHGKVEQIRKVAEVLKPDAVFQTGDFGFFANITSADRVARRHIKKDSSQKEIFSYLRKEKTFPYPLYFVRGNHEDFRLLERFEELGLRNMYYLRTGVQNIGSITVAAIGGIYYWGNSPKKRNSPKFSKEEEIKFIFTGKKVDICLAHDAPEGKGLMGGIGGSLYVSLAIEMLKPDFLFHGHYGNPPDPYEIGDTHVYPMTMWSGRSRQDGLFAIGEALVGLLQMEEGELKFHYVLENEIGLNFRG